MAAEVQTGKYQAAKDIAAGTIGGVWQVLTAMPFDTVKGASTSAAVTRTAVRMGADAAASALGQCAWYVCRSSTQTEPSTV